MEKNINEIKWLSIDELHPHPDNPRKDLGDLSELSESIKAKGVMQNLTVVKSQNSDGYTVIIGHRRTEAARLAGLTELPCIVADMTPAEQVQTMLLENMQRSDLTAYEQAQGFQMMIDFGDSIEEVSQKTGFSQKTVRTRLKMAKLDGEKMKEISSRQITMTDFEKLFDIDDVSTQNELLDDIGTSNFEQKLRYKLRKQNITKLLPLVKEEIKKLKGKSISRSETYGGKYNLLVRIRFHEEWNGKTPLFENVPEDKKLFYYLDEDWGEVSIYTQAEKAKPVKRSAEEIEKEKKIEDTWKTLEQASADMYEMRKSFIENINVTAKNTPAIMHGAYVSSILHSVNWMGSTNCLYDLADTSKEEYGKKARKTIEVLKDKKELIARVIYATFVDSANEQYFCGWRKAIPEHKENLKLDTLYDWLISLGYEMSDEEKAHRYGTCPFFAKSDEEEYDEDEISNPDIDDCDGDCENCPDQDICDEYDATLLDEPDEILEKLKQFSEEEEDE